MESSERKAHVCCDCKARSPETDTNYTLISSRYGWRLSRHIATDGTFVVEWRCPRCWERHKMRKGGSGSDSLAPGSRESPPPGSGRESPPPASNDSSRATRSSPAPPLRAASSSPPARKKK